MHISIDQFRLTFYKHRIWMTILNSGNFLFCEILSNLSVLFDFQNWFIGTFSNFPGCFPSFSGAPCQGPVRRNAKMRMTIPIRIFSGAVQDYDELGQFIKAVGMAFSFF